MVGESLNDRLPRLLVEIDRRPPERPPNHPGPGRLGDDIRGYEPREAVDSEAVDHEPEPRVHGWAGGLSPPRAFLAKDTIFPGTFSPRVTPPRTLRANSERDRPASDARLDNHSYSATVSRTQNVRPDMVMSQSGLDA